MSRAKTNRRKGAKKELAARYVFPVVIEKDQEGYFAVCPSLQGCYTEGDTYEEALRNIEDAVRLHVADRLACGEPIPVNDRVSLTTVEVQV
jgi:predicted RNase H-like HicB family nuclease